MNSVFRAYISLVIQISLLFSVCVSTAQAGFEILKTEEKDLKTISRLLEAPDGQYRAVMALAKTKSSSHLDAYGNLIFCTGFAVARNWIVTGAHCVSGHDSPVHNVVLLAGNANLAKAKSITIEKIIVHPKYTVKAGLPANDIALVKTKEPLETPPLAIARYPASKTFQGKQSTGAAVVAGWGFLTETWEISRDSINQNPMRHLSVRYISRKQCNESQSYDGKVDELQFCAASVLNSIDVCQGFGGAPLLAFDARGRQFAVGLVSWGEGCARKEKPTVYTDIGSYIEWIEGNVENLKAKPAFVAQPSVSDLRTVTYPDIATTDSSMRLINPSPNLAPTGLFRYMVSIGKSNQHPTLGHFCGGVLISKRYVLTAAHCVSQYTQSPTELRLKIDSSVLSRGGVFLRATRIIVHEDYEPRPAGPPLNDIALVQISGNVPTDIIPPPVSTPATEAQMMNVIKDATVIGWGKNAFSSFAQTSNFLHWTPVALVDDQTCSQNHSKTITNEMLCAGNEMSDSCQGDSGGPLFSYGLESGFLSCRVGQLGRRLRTGQKTRSVCPRIRILQLDQHQDFSIIYS